MTYGSPPQIVMSNRIKIDLNARQIHCLLTIQYMIGSLAEPFIYHMMCLHESYKKNNFSCYRYIFFASNFCTLYRAKQA